MIYLEETNMKHIKLFGMDFDVAGKWLIGSSKDLDKLGVIILTFIFAIILCLLF